MQVIINRRSAMAKICRPTGCPVAFTLDLFGDRWSLLIVRDMLLCAKRNYGEFMESPEKIASNILAERLKRLEAACIITKSGDADNQRKIIYELTSKGLDLIPLILESIVWGAKHDTTSVVPKAFVRRILSQREVVTREIIAAVKRGERYLPR